MRLLPGEGYLPAFMGDPLRGGVCTLGVLGMDGPGLGCCHCGCVYMMCSGGDACDYNDITVSGRQESMLSVCATALGHPCCLPCLRGTAECQQIPLASINSASADAFNRCWKYLWWHVRVEPGSAPVLVLHACMHVRLQ